MSQRHPNRMRLPLFCIALLLLLLPGGCGNTPVLPRSTSASRISVQLSWIHTIEFVGLYAAIKEGYYADANLDVQLHAGGFDKQGHFIDPVQQVIAGASDFGIGGADLILKARAQGQPVVAVAALYQRSPVVLISLAENNILRPRDLIGKRVTVQSSTEVDTAYRALLASQGIDHTQIHEIPQTNFTVEPLFNNETDVFPGFVTNEAVQARRRSETVHLMVLSDYAIELYSDVLFTTDTMIENHPDLVQAYVAATIRGLQWSVDNPEEAARYILDTYGSAMEPELQNIQQEGMLASVPLISPGGSPPGMMDPTAWDYAHQVLLDHGILKAPLDVSAAYTMRFLQQVR